jgi:hypothetical protein
MCKIKREIELHIKEPAYKLKHSEHIIIYFMIKGLVNIYHSEMLKSDPTYKHTDITLSKFCKFNGMEDYVKLDYKKMI